MDNPRTKKLVGIIVLLILGMFSSTMCHSLNHDEHMYICAGVLVQDNALYTDFAYLQMPYLPLLYGALFQLTNTTYYLLWGRLLTFIFMIASTVLIYQIAYKLAKNHFVALWSTIFFAWCHPIIHVMPFAWNHTVPITFSLLAFYLYINGIKKFQINITYLFFAGFSLGVVVGTKLNYAVMLFPYFIILLFYPKSLKPFKRVLKLYLPILTGAFIGLLPLIIIYVKTDSDVFIFNNLGYHQINALWRTLTGYTLGMFTLGKMEFAWRELAYPSNLSIFLAVLYMLILYFKEKSFHKYGLKPFINNETLLCLLIVMFAILASFVPSPMFASYFSMSIPFVIIFVSLCYGNIKQINKLPIKVLLICLTILGFFYGGVRLFRYLPDLPGYKDWTTISVHRAARDIRDQIGDDGIKQKMATLSPIFALESGLPIYKELATGPFLFRIGDMLSDYERINYIGTSPNSLHALLEKDPPSSIYVGHEGDLDQPFISYAEKNDYINIEGKYAGGILYVRNKNCAK